MAAAQAPVKGEAAFKENCALCHGENGGGSDMGKALKVKDLRTKEVQDETSEALAKIVRDGKNNMPPFKSRLSDAQIDELIGYIRHLAEMPAH
jgi:cytochrome c6